MNALHSDYPIMDYSLSSAGETYLPLTIEPLKTELAK
jgi:hypothetical protein